jgi:TRAP-type uncharacterized transport system substrate-binding protein
MLNRQQRAVATHCSTRAIPSALSALIFLSPVAHAAEQRFDTINRGVVELETGGAGGGSVRIAEDLAALVDDGATRRVLPVVGRSALQNLGDLVALHGIDMAILQADVVEGAKGQRADAGFDYIAKLYNEEFHILAGPEVKSIADLANKRVAIGVRGSGTAFTAARLFNMMNVPVEFVNERPELSIEKLRAGGDLAAVAFVAGKPASLFTGLPPGTHLHFLPIPLAANVVGSYVPGTLTVDDYPSLIAADESIDTVAVGTILAVARMQPNGERYRNIANFVDVFFTGFRSLLEPGHHPKWREINLAAEVPGLTRFLPAQQWLDRNAAVAVRPTAPDVRTLFSRFLDTRQQALGSAPISDQQKQELFDQFQRWQAGQIR